MTEGDRVILRRYGEAGVGVLHRRGPSGRWMVIFEDRNWLPRWATEDEMMREPLSASVGGHAPLGRLGASC